MIKSFTRSACHNAVITPPPLPGLQEVGCNRRFEQGNYQTSFYRSNLYHQSVLHKSTVIILHIRQMPFPTSMLLETKKINFIYDYSKRLSLSLQYTHLEQLFKIVVLTMYVATYLGRKGGVVTQLHQGVACQWPRSQTFYLVRIVHCVSDRPDSLRYIWTQPRTQAVRSRNNERLGYEANMDWDENMSNLFSH